MDSRRIPSDEITSHEILERRDGGAHSVVLVDVRGPSEYVFCRIKGGILIPLRQLASRVGELDADAETAVYCHHGIRSLQALQYLKQAGFIHAPSLQGGIDTWSLMIDPSLPRY